MTAIYDEQHGNNLERPCVIVAWRSQQQMSGDGTITGDRVKANDITNALDGKTRGHRKKNPVLGKPLSIKYET